MKFTYSNSLPPPPKHLLTLYLQPRSVLWPIDHDNPIGSVELKAIYAFTGHNGGFMYHRGMNKEGLYEPKVL